MGDTDLSCIFFSFQDFVHLFYFSHLKHASFFHLFFRSLLETFPHFLEGNVAVHQLVIAVFPLDTVFLGEFLLVLIHVAHEVDGEVLVQVEFPCHHVWNGTQVRQDGNNVRLLEVVGGVKVIISDQVVSALDVWSDVGKFLDILGVAHQ